MGICGGSLQHGGIEVLSQKIRASFFARGVKELKILRDRFPAGVWIFLILTAFYCRLADWILAQRCELVNWIRSQLQVLSFCDPCKNVQICKNVHPKQGRSCVAYEFIIGACQPHPCLVWGEKLHFCFTWNYRVIWIYKNIWYITFLSFPKFGEMGRQKMMLNNLVIEMKLLKHWPIVRNSDFAREFWNLKTKELTPDIWEG